MSHAVQCLLCKNAKRGSRRSRVAKSLKIGDSIPTPIGCDVLGELPDSATAHYGVMAEIVGVLLFQHAASHRCPAYDRFVIEDGSYFAEDLPERDTVVSFCAENGTVHLYGGKNRNA